MADQAFVIEDYFSEKANRMQQPEASPVNKSDSGLEAASVIKDEQQTNQGEKARSKEQDEEQQKKIVTEEPPSSEQSPPTAQEAADFLPFRRSVMETDTLLE